MTAIAIDTDGQLLAAPAPSSEDSLSIGAVAASATVLMADRLVANAAAATAQSSDLEKAANYLLDDVLGLDRTSKLVTVSAKRGTSDGQGGEKLVTLEVHYAAGAWPKEIIEALPSFKIFSFSFNPADLLGDHSKVIKIEEQIRSELNGFVAGFVDDAVSGIKGIERGVAVAAGDTLKALLASEIMKPLSGELVQSLFDLDLPDGDDVGTILGNAFDKLGSDYFKDFVPQMAKTYAKLGLSEILTAATSGIEPKWADAIGKIGSGVLEPVIGKLVDDYFDVPDKGAKLDGDHFAKTLGNVLADVLVDFKALDKQIIDDILGIDGNSWIETQISTLLSDKINGFVKNSFVEAIKFLGGDFDVTSIEKAFTDFIGDFDVGTLQTLLGNFFVDYGGSQLAQLFVNIDSLPEALVSKFGSMIASEALGEVIGSITMGAVSELFGSATAGAIGTAIFNGLGAVLGAGIGAVAGSLVFELLDDLFDGAISGLFNQVVDWIRNDSPQAFYKVGFDPVQNAFVFVSEYSKDSNDQMRAAVKAISDATQDRIETVIQLVGKTAKFDSGYDNFTTVWGKKHFDSKYAAFLGNNESAKIGFSGDPDSVLSTSVGALLAHMNFHDTNPVLSAAYDLWKARIGVNAASSAFTTPDAFDALQKLIGLAHFANAYRQDPTLFDDLMASDAPAGVTILQQYFEADSLGFNDAIVIHGSDVGLEEVGSAAAGDTIHLDGTGSRAVARGGDDTVYGSARADAIFGGTGDDKLYGKDGDDEIAGDEGADELYGWDGNDQLWGGAGDDKILADAGNDTVDGGNGDDEVYGFDGNDALQGGLGDDRLFGETGADVLSGGSGDDVLDGGLGDDAIEGGDGSDIAVIHAKIASATVVAQPLGNGALELRSSDGVDTISGVETLRFTDRDISTGQFGAIERAYLNYGGRDATFAELIVWTDLLASGATVADVRAAIIGDPLGGQAIDAAYRSVFGRAATSDEVATWRGLFRSGGDLTSLKAALNAENAAVDARVDSLYQAYGLRHASTAELAVWRPLVRGGATDGAVKAAIVDDPLGGAAIDRTYVDLFGRHAAASEIATWRGLLKGGATLADLRAAILAEPAGQTHARAEIAEAYRDLGGRMPSDVEVKTWLGLLGGSETLWDLRDTILGEAMGQHAASRVNVAYQEYFGRAAKADERSTWFDLFRSGANSDTLLDTLFSDAGSSAGGVVRVSGKTGADTIEVRSDHLLITGFNPAQDTVDLRKAGWAHPDPLGHAREVTSLDGRTDVLISWDDDHSILLTGLSSSALSTNDFLI